MATLRLEITLPDELLQAYLQTLRDFDTQHHIEIAIGIEAPGLDAATVQQIFRNIRPPFENQWVFQGPGAA